MNLYYKATRPDGKNSWDGSIDYRGNIGKRIVCPGWRGKEAASLCSETVLHASADPLDSISYSRIPCALFEVRGSPMVRGDDKCGFRALTVVREIPVTEMDDLLGFRYTEAINPVNPLKVTRKVTEADRRNLKAWASVRASMWASVRVSVRPSVWDSVWASVRASMWDSVRASLWESVWDSVWASVGDSMWDSVGASVRDSVWDSVWASAGDSVWASVWASAGDSVGAYASSLYPGIKDWKYINHEPGANPFQPAIELWHRGFIPINYDGKWHMWNKKHGVVYTMEVLE